MKKKLSSLYYLIPVVYVGFILFFIYLQFNAKEDFGEKVGNLTVSGITASRTFMGKREISELKVVFDNIGFVFTPSEPLLVEFLNGKSRKLKVQAYSTFPEGLEIEFTGNLRLRFDLHGSLGDRLSLNVVLTEGFGVVSMLSIPFETIDAELETVRGIPLFTLKNSLTHSFISLPPGSKVDFQQSRVQMNLHQVDALILIERFRDIDPYEYWFTRDFPLISEESYEKRKLDYLDKSYRGWKQLGLTQVVPDLEILGSAMLSEALKRGEYRLILPFFAKALRQYSRSNPEQSSPFLTTVYLGNLASYMERRQATGSAQIRRITEQIKQLDLTVLKTPDLIRFILNQAPFSLLEEVVRLADSVSLQRIDTDMVLALLETYLELERWIGSSESARARSAEIVQERLLPAILKSSSGLFLHTRAEEVDLFLSIWAGRLLIRTAAIIDRPAIKTIGRNLILSALGLADSLGYLPESCRVSPEQIELGPMTLNPERVYPLVAEVQHLPAEQPLYRFLYPGCWIWTAARTGRVIAGDRSFAISFKFPVGEPHYLIIQGLKPIYELKMHGIQWNSDPQYFRYSDGWLYDSRSQTLFMKITHRKEEEQIQISY